MSRIFHMMPDVRDLLEELLPTLEGESAEVLRRALDLEDGIDGEDPPSFRRATFVLDVPIGSTMNNVADIMIDLLTAVEDDEREVPPLPLRFFNHWGVQTVEPDDIIDAGDPDDIEPGEPEDEDLT